MSLHKLFKTDTGLEKKGVWIDYGPNEDMPADPDGKHPSTRFLIARAGGSNNAYNQVLEKLAKPHKRMIQHGQLSNDLAKTIARDAFLSACLLGWENVTNAAGEVLEFNKPNADALFDELPDLYSDLSEQAAQASIYREELREADLGNSGRSLSTDSSKDQ